MMLTASHEDDLEKAGAAMWMPEVQAALKGDTALINLMDTEFKTISLKLGPSYYLGGVSPLPFIEYYANTYPMYLIGGVLLCCILLSSVFYYLFKNQKKEEDCRC